jgi:hypothetical protein
LRVFVRKRPNLSRLIAFTFPLWIWLLL